MLNVPTGFKLASERFKATLDLDADAALKAFRRLILDPKPFGGDGASLPSFLTERTVNINLSDGPVVVQAAPRVLGPPTHAGAPR